MEFYSKMFNQTYVNQTYYHQNQAQVQRYQQEQNCEVLKAQKAFRDLCEAVKKMDVQHQEQAFFLCLAEAAYQFGWDGKDNPNRF